MREEESQHLYRRHVYNQAELEMLDEFKRDSDSKVGWLPDEASPELTYPVWQHTAEAGFMKHMAHACFYKNRLYRDEEYARTTRWGGVIAPPFFVKHFTNIGYGHHLALTPGCGRFVGMSVGEIFVNHKPIRAGDSFRIYTMPASIEDVTPDGEQPERNWKISEEMRFYNQRDELVTRNLRVNTLAVAEDGTPFDNVLRMGYEMAPVENSAPLDVGEVRQTAEYIYTPEETAAIDAMYAAEPVRGKETRWWEDVEVGDDLSPIVFGPITTWDTICHMGTFGKAPLNSMEIRTRTPWDVIIDPRTGIPHKTLEIHVDGRIAELVGWYSATIIEPIIHGFFGRLATQWMGDDGFIRYYAWKKFCNTNYGDTIFGRGRVTRKYVDEVTGACLVDVDARMENVRGFLTNMAPLSIELASREQIHEGRAPKTPSAEPLAWNPEGLKPGDKVTVRSRPEWEMPTPYPLAGEVATVYQMFEQPGYVFLLFDNDCTGLDPRVPVGFAIENLERV